MPVTADAAKADSTEMGSAKTGSAKTQSAKTIVRGACPHDCPDTCAMLVTVQDGRATEVRGDPEHPFTRGALCLKVNDYATM